MQSFELGRALASHPPSPASTLDTRSSPLTHNNIQYTAAAKTSTLEPTAKALESLHKTFTSDPKLIRILSAPTLSDSDKSQVVNELIKSSGAPASDKTMRNFMETLAANNRLSVLKGVTEKFGELMGAHRGEVEMRVTSAAPLDQKVVRSLEQTVGRSQYVGQGKKLKTVTRVSCFFSFLL